MPKGFPSDLGVQGGAWGLGAGVYLGGPEVQQVLKGLSQGAQLLFQAVVRVPNPLSLLRFQKGGDRELACPPTRSSPIPSFPRLAGGRVAWPQVPCGVYGLQVPRASLLRLLGTPESILNLPFQ